jgi:transcription elongation GreA/GreB family factor
LLPLKGASGLKTRFPDKIATLNAFIEHFQQEWNILVRSARSAHEAATHEETKAEDRHDTFAIEASYLAAGQSARLLELARTIKELEGYLALSQPGEGVKPGHLVAYRYEEEIQVALLAHSGGGAKIHRDPFTIQILSPQSPFGEQIIGLRTGDQVEFEIRGNAKRCQILEII